VCHAVQIAMDNPFKTLSHLSLQDALLNRLSRIANLRKESKHLRSRLSDLRSELHAAEFELVQIQQCLDLEKVAQFPESFIDITPEKENRPEANPGPAPQRRRAG
jgi:hypothetical protein